jgi:iron complex transport system permease protein
MKRTRILTLLLLLAILAASVLAGLLIGAASPSELFDPANRVILLDLRIPRVLLAGLCGAALALAGLVFQSLLANPLAEPYTLGISGGAALGAGLAGLVPLTGLLSVGLVRPVFAAGGSLLAVGLIFFLAERRKFSSDGVVLAGVVTSYLFSSFVLFLYAILRPLQLQNVMLWLMGDLSSASPQTVLAVTPVFLVFFIFFLLIRNEMDILSFGEEKASALGLDAGRARRLIFLLASLMTGLCVAVAGVIGFVGLIVPQLMRKLIGGRHDRLIPASLCAGASFLILCDAFSRSVIRPVELPVGVVTGLCGGIFFLATFLRRRSSVA